MRVQVTAKTGTKVTKVIEKAPNHFQVSVKASPIEGKANIAIAKALAKHLQVSPSRVVLYRGQKSKEKVFDIF